jgi:16S rRNA (guanine527-N7)-methyltransferase
VGVSRETLAALLDRHGLPATAGAQFESLLEALAAEADPHTTVSEPAAALEVHVADSLSGLEVDDLRQAGRIADLGAGAGFPGLALAIALEPARVDLIESARRKGAVIDRLIGAAGVSNARSVVARAEEWAALPAPLGGREAYDAVSARAVGPLALLAEYAAPLLRQGGVLVAWKGAREAAEERAAAAAAKRLGLELEGARRVVPFPGARRRHLHVLRKTGPTPDGIPRRPGMAAKRPLG